MASPITSAALAGYAIGSGVSYITSGDMVAGALLAIAGAVALFIVKHGNYVLTSASNTTLILEKKPGQTPVEVDVKWRLNK